MTGGMRRFSASCFAVAAVLFLLITASTDAVASWKKVSGRDKEDGSALQGIALTSDDGQARLFFLCDEDKTVPQIMIAHKQVIGKPSDPFRVSYLIDDNDEQIHWFLTKGSGKTGYFFVRYPADYEERFGDQPEPFTQGSNEFNPDYIAWDRNIYMTLVQDFLKGTVGLIRIRDKEKKNHYYSFILLGMQNVISELSSCYETPEPLPPAQD